MSHNVSQRTVGATIDAVGADSPLLNPAVTLHQQVFQEEFIARLGHRFLRRYYQAFASSPYAVVLIATSEGNQCLGALVGTYQPIEHYEYLTRHYGIRLALAMITHSLVHPKVAALFIRTRFTRYLFGVLRQVRSMLRREASFSSPREQERPPQPSMALSAKTDGQSVQVGEITHLFVNPEMRSRGLGGKLVRHYESLARRAGVDRVDLVTLPYEKGGAGPFYEQLGWRHHSTKFSRSGEEFCLYQKMIDVDTRG